MSLVSQPLCFRPVFAMAASSTSPSLAPANEQDKPVLCSLMILFIAPWFLIFLDPSPAPVLVV